MSTPRNLSSFAVRRASVRSHRALLVAAWVISAAACDDDASAPRAPSGSQDDGGELGEQTSSCAGTAYPAYVSDARMCVTVFASKLSSPRQMAFANNGDLFVSTAGITVLWDDNRDGSSDAGERASVAAISDLRHGLAFDRDQTFLYAASDNAVLRFSYLAGQRSALGAPETVVRDIPRGGHSTRSLVFDSQGRLYVSVGSASNVDGTEDLWQTRSLIRRYDPKAGVPASGFDYLAGEVVASGMRNEVGLFVDAEDRLWGVENGRDNLSDGDLGGDIHNDNPAEKINLVDGKGPTFYGYPFCYTEFKAAGGLGAGTQWADQTLTASIQKTDAWCRDPANVRAPMFSLPAHTAPLGIIQYTGKLLPFQSDFIVAAHGSWNRSPAVGRMLLRARYRDGQITAADAIVGEKAEGGSLKEGSWDARPVDVRQGPDEALYFSDDQGGRVFKVGYK